MFLLHYPCLPNAAHGPKYSQFGKIDVYGQLLRFEFFPKRFEKGMSQKNLRLDNNNIQVLFRGDLFYKIVKISSAVLYLFLYFILTSL